MNNLNKVISRLKELKLNEPYIDNYYVPCVWLGDSGSGEKIRTNPFDFFLESIDKIHKLSLKKKIKQDDKHWSDFAIVYNMIPRLTTAYDHNNDGIINNVEGNSKLKETGTFLKCIAFLPYLVSLGVNTIYLLPVTSIGLEGRKGNSGSPYAVRNPYKLDENLSEPVLEMDVDLQFAAYTEAAHLLGIKVVIEFVFRTASIDSDLALEHPDWFYWIKEKELKNYKAPSFTADELLKIKTAVEIGHLTKLPPPHENYKNLFTKVPGKVRKDKGKIKGFLEDGSICVIPSAFADWPPDDTQPAWSDVTYLRLYTHPDFNYIAYNTIRMYDKKLAHDENRVNALWESITGVIPYYIEKFKIDGVMLDMGHSLPQPLMSLIIEKARGKNPEFVFWEENFSLDKKSKKEGFNASLGYMPFDQHVHWKMKEVIKMLAGKGSPIPFFLTPETHNTHRATERNGGINFTKFAYAVNNFLPGITFIHSGFELGEKFPVNTGLGFEEAELNKYPSDKLPLFSISSLDWNNSGELLEFFRKISRIRKDIFKENEENYKPETIIQIDNNNEHLISFIRKLSYMNHDFLFLANMHPHDNIHEAFNIKNGVNFKDLLTDSNFTIYDSKLYIELKPFEVMCGIVF